MTFPTITYIFQMLENRCSKIVIADRPRSVNDVSLESHWKSPIYLIPNSEHIFGFYIDRQLRESGHYNVAENGMYFRTHVKMKYVYMLNAAPKKVSEPVPTIYKGAYRIPKRDYSYSKFPIRHEYCIYRNNYRKLLHNV